MSTNRSALLLAAIWAFGSLLGAGQAPGAASPPDRGPDEVVLTRETCRGLFIVPVTVGPGRGTTLDLLLDTGSAWTVVDRDALRRVLGKDTDAGKVSLASIRAGGHNLGPQKAIVHPMARLSRALGRKLDGILGFPAFHELLLTLDYPAGEVRISRGRLPRANRRQVFRYKGPKRPHIELVVGGQRLQILLDSGAAGHFRLKPEDRLSWSVEPKEARSSVGFKKFRVDKIGRLNGKLEFGPLSFEDPIVTVVDEKRYAGWHVLRHFVLTFDQRKRRMLMEPARPSPVRMPPVVSSGVAFRPKPDGLEVARVFPGTPAAASGLREGDLVLAIDGTPVYERGCADPEGVAAGDQSRYSFLSAGATGETTITFDTLIP